MLTTDLQRTRRILLVDSNRTSRIELRAGLEMSGLEFIEADSVAAANACLAATLPDLLLSEVELSDGSGFALSRSLRDELDPSRKPAILLVSRWRHASERILGFECGADDFVTRPFSMRELAVRVRGLLRRRDHRLATSNGTWPVVNPKCGVVVDTERHAAWIGDRPISLTLREFAILSALCQNHGRVLTRSELMAQVREDGKAPSGRSIDAHVKGLRHKLGDGRGCIETVRGRGYRYSEAKAVQGVRGREQ